MYAYKYMCYIYIISKNFLQLCFSNCLSLAELRLIFLCFSKEAAMYPLVYSVERTSDGSGTLLMCKHPPQMVLELGEKPLSDLFKPLVSYL